MDMPLPPAPAAQAGRRASAVVDRKLDELCARLDDALSSRQRSPYAEERLRAEIKLRTDFLRSLLAAEAECHGGAGAGAARPDHLAEAEARFAVLAATFDQWARRAVVVVAAPDEPAEEVAAAAAAEADCSGSSSCSCTDSCQEAAATEEDAKQRDAVETTRGKEGTTSDGIAEDDSDDERETAEEIRRDAAADGIADKPEEATLLDAVVANKRDADREAAAETTGRRAVRRRWWRQGATAWCGAAGVVAVIALGLAVELAAVAHHNVNVYVVPT